MVTPLLLVTFILILVAFMLTILNAVTGKPQLWLPMLLLCVAGLLRAMLWAGLRSRIL